MNVKLSKMLICIDVILPNKKDNQIKVWFGDNYGFESNIGGPTPA